MSQPERTLHIGETDYIGVRFRGEDLPTGVTVASSTVAVLPVAGLTLVAGATAIVTVAADGAYAWVTAVTAGDYVVNFTVVFSDTKHLIRGYTVRIVA